MSGELSSREVTRRACGNDGDRAFRRRLFWLHERDIVPRPDKRGPFNTSPFAYDASFPAVATILFYALDNLGMNSRALLRDLYRYLSEPLAPGRMTAIDEILEDVGGGGSPRLFFISWLRAADAHAVKGVDLRLTGDRSAHVGPTGDHRAMVETAVDLRALLLPFVESNVVPFPIGEA